MDQVYQTSLSPQLIAGLRSTTDWLCPPESLQAVSMIYRSGRHQVVRESRTSTTCHLKESLAELPKIIEQLESVTHTAMCPLPGIDIIDYKPGGFFKPHRDHVNQQHSHATLYVALVYLRTCQEGGETRIKGDREYLIPAEEGHVVLFQSHLIHEGLPVIKGWKRILKIDILVMHPLGSGIPREISLHPGFNRFNRVEDYLHALVRHPQAVPISVALRMDYHWSPAQCMCDTEMPLEAAEKNFVKHYRHCAHHGIYTASYDGGHDRCEKFRHQIGDHTNESDQFQWRDTVDDFTDSDDSEDDCDDENDENDEINNEPTCTMCRIGKELEETHNEQSEDNYYGLRLIKTVMQYDLDGLIKQITIGGRTIRNLSQPYLFRDNKRHCEMDVYSRALGKYAHWSGGETFQHSFGSHGADQLSEVKKLYQAHIPKVLTFPRDYPKMLEALREQIMIAVLDDPSNTPVRLSHAQKANCNECDYLDFTVGFVLHFLYLE